jgi:hypothetical protein
MSEGFIGTTGVLTVSVHVLHLDAILMSEIGAGDALVGVGGFLCDRPLASWAVRMAAAAADGEQPEEGGAEGEGDGEPGDGEHLASERGFDLVWS